MAKISTLYEPFDGTTLPGTFVSAFSPTSVSVGSGVLSIVTQASWVEGAVADTTSYDWTTSECIVKFASVPDSGIHFCPRMVSGDGATLFPALSCNGFAWQAGFRSWNNGFGSYGSASNTNRWGRIKHDGTNVEYAHSADGTTWTTFHTQVASTFGTLTARGLYIIGQSSAAQTFTVDQVGVAPAASAKFRDYFITG